MYFSKPLVFVNQYILEEFLITVRDCSWQPWWMIEITDIFGFLKEETSCVGYYLGIQVRSSKWALIGQLRFKINFLLVGHIAIHPEGYRAQVS